ncbi:hypothetical protein EDB83DRAFT_2522661 [Lactarius deliciosus]|nr:hypothetical protein EDB83DRAFT_2522661 [Lactarius deliciosus]
MSSTLDVNGRNYPPTANPHVYFARPVSLDTRLLVAPLFTHDPLISTGFPAPPVTFLLDVSIRLGLGTGLLSIRVGCLQYPVGNG